MIDSWPLLITTFQLINATGFIFFISGFLICLYYVSLLPLIRHYAITLPLIHYTIRQLC